MKHLYTYAFAFLLACPYAYSQQAETSSTEIKAFNQTFAAAMRSMDNSAILALWAENGISLLPDTKPLIGKAAIGKFMDDVTAPLKGASMETFDLACFDIAASGDWASEWCTEHQVVRLPDGKPAFDGRGKLLFVLHKEPDGKWRFMREMWNHDPGA